MIALASGVRVYLACGVTDMRKGMVGLAMLVSKDWARIHSMARFTPSVGAAPG